MKYYIYLNVPQYVKEWAEHSFDFDGVGIRVNKSFALSGFIYSHLSIRKDWYPKEECGNLAVQIHNLSDNHQKSSWNYMSVRDRKRLAHMFHQVMFSEYWFFMLPHWRAISGGKKTHGTTMQGFTLQWFEQKKITCNENAILRFNKDFYREKQRALDNYNVIFN